MRWLARLAFLLLFAIPLYGQGMRYDNFVLKPLAAGGVTPVSGALITVCTSAGSGTPCTPKVANIFSDEALSVPITGTGGAGTTNSDANGNFGFYAAPGSYIVTVTGTGVTSYTIKLVLPIGAATGATIGALNGRCEIDGVKYTTLASAFADSTCKVIDDRGFKSGGTIASTITWPNRSVVLLLAPADTALYTGPASGPAILMNNSLNNASSIIGGGMTANNQAQYGNGTMIRANASNTSPLIQILSGSAQTIQGITIENLVLDGNNSATDCLQLDAVRNSMFIHDSYNNCTSFGIHMIVTNTLANQGNQFNTFYGVFGGGSPQLMFLDGNSNATSSATLNWFHDIAASFSCASCAGIEIKQGDGNTFDIKQLFPTNGAFSGDCVKVDSPVGGSVEGGLFNYFVDYHVACAQGAIGGNSFHAGANTYGNRIDRFDGIENQGLPLVDAGAQLDYNLDRANSTNILFWNANKLVGWGPTGANTPDIGFIRCGGGRIDLSTAYNCAGQGSLDMGTLGLAGSAAGKVSHTVPATVTSYTETDPAAAPASNQSFKVYTTAGVGSFSINTVTLKKGSGGGNYTNATTSYTVADSTNLCYTVTIPTGWKLGISASGALSTATAAVVAQAALTDNAACSTANAGILVETAPIQGAGIGIADAFALNWVITGDGAAHNIAMQFKTSNAADTASLINASATQVPTMKFELIPSN